ncbi:hypothetical protein OCU04_002144 [Sclerotinia nivalis]|uniref:Uncharacterized protein n=1 Tax=Sclerotinia nivalis TaxID=352851 RepID=A0A9X0AZI4_9HELO|nr:hypothetical protein OCU04_002144 [Sclerotinia nivalis]
MSGAVWSSIECNIGIVCASVPPFKPLFDRFFLSLISRPVGASHPKRPSRLELRHNAGNYIKQNNKNEYELESGKKRKVENYL